MLILAIFLGMNYTKFSLWLLGKGDVLDEQPHLYWLVMHHFVGANARLICWFISVLQVNYKKKKISDYIADYLPYEIIEGDNGENRAPLAISNHNGNIDMFFFLTLKGVLSFVANDNIRKMPLIGNICTRVQSLYLDRAKTIDKNQTMDAIYKRVDQVMNQKTNHPTLMLFPEGTTNNGEWMMNFKKGAFVPEVPFKIYGLQVHAKMNPCWNLVNMGPNFIFMLCNWGVGLTVHEFDSFNPKYTIEKRNLKPKDEDNWKYIVEDVYYLMDYGFDIKHSGNSFQDKVQLKKDLNIGVR